ncbi:MAG: hypothetical protein ACOCU8_02535 [Patescibacteria group bacterium]
MTRESNVFSSQESEGDNKYIKQFRDLIEQENWSAISSALIKLRDSGEIVKMNNDEIKQFDEFRKEIVNKVFPIAEEGDTPEKEINQETKELLDLLQELISVAVFKK